LTNFCPFYDFFIGKVFEGKEEDFLAAKGREVGWIWLNKNNLISIA